MSAAQPVATPYVPRRAICPSGPEFKGVPLKFTADEADKHLWLKRLGIRTVLDVGANNGGFAKEIRSILPDAFIYSFEPVKDVWEYLNHCCRKLERWQSFNLALGERSGPASIYRNDFTPASSILPLTEAIKEQLPFVKDMTSEPIRMVRLDDVLAAGELDLQPHVLLKLDAEGYEDRIIKGAAEMLKRVRLVICETGFAKFHENQPVFADIYELMRAAGFAYLGSWAAQKSPKDGAPYAEDSIYARVDADGRFAEAW